MISLLQQWATARAEECPEDVALVFEEVKLTYGRLETLSNQLARLLKESGCQRGDRVCVLVPKSPQAVVAFLGTLKADCIYVPIDPASPPTRIARILESCENRWILAGGPVVPLLGEVLSDAELRRRLSIGWMGDENFTGGCFVPAFSISNLASYPIAPLSYANVSTDPAHILFTSGSTGAPKGVMITHQSVIHFVRWGVREFGISGSDRLSGHPPLHFDLSTFDIYATLATGAELHLVPPRANLLPTRLAEFIRSSELTQWFSVPSVLSYMATFDVVRFNDFPTLRRLLWCGEVLPTPSLIYWMTRLPKVRFTNLYGPTETTIASSYYSVPSCPSDERAPLPIGRPCDGEELLVLDEALRPVRNGDVGQLYIRGMGLSPGYWKNPEATSAAFVSYSANGNGHVDRIYKTGDLASVGEDGLLYFHGRNDSQIKSRGYRIELGEIEAGLNTIESLRESAVVAIQTNGFEGATVCCAYVSDASNGVGPADLRKALAKMLPPYMLPSRWMPLQALPRNPNGKIDRPKLGELFQRQRDELEGTLDEHLGD